MGGEAVSLQDLEVFLKKSWEGMFKKGARALHPVEIARALVRAMVDQRRVSISRVYAPNVFIVRLGSTDFDQIAPLQSALARELEEHVLVQADEKGFTLIGQPEVSFEEDQALETGADRIESSFKASEDGVVRIGHVDDTGMGRTSELIRIDQTTIFNKKEVNHRDAAGSYLTVIQGPDMGKIFSLSRENEQKCFTIGRKMTNSIYLTDINASREHAQLEWQDGSLFLKDLKSHNGTFVNSDRIEERQVGIDDLIQIGENIFQIEEGE
jgi:hypothetical protein